jgi:hypothetical protein
MINKITPLGGGLKILIKCNYDISHDWMAFSSWYSIAKYLPDAQVRILCSRMICEHQIFNWPNRCKVEFSFTKKSDDDDFFVIKPDVMAVGDYDDIHLGPINCKLSEASTFVSYAEGCGQFMPDFKQCPFAETHRFFSENLTFNEYRILKIWDKANTTYISVM